MASQDSPSGVYVMALHAYCREAVCGSTNMGWFAVRKSTGEVSEWDVAGEKQARSGAEMLTQAEQSFSRIPFGSKEPPPRLSLLDRRACEQFGECTYRDAREVQHYYWEGELVVKAIAISQADRRPIDALGIGTARSRNEVVQNVRRFLVDAEVKCRPHSEEPDRAFTCGASLGEGWITLTFTGNGRLTEAKVDAYRFT